MSARESFDCGAHTLGELRAPEDSRRVTAVRCPECPPAPLGTLFGFPIVLADKIPPDAVYLDMASGPDRTVYGHCFPSPPDPLERHRLPRRYESDGAMLAWLKEALGKLPHHASCERLADELGATPSHLPAGRYVMDGCARCEVSSLLTMIEMRWRLGLVIR